MIQIGIPMSPSNFSPDKSLNVPLKRYLIPFLCKLWAISSSVIITNDLHSFGTMPIVHFPFTSFFSLIGVFLHGGIACQYLHVLPLAVG